jgi:hypothetical protein
LTVVDTRITVPAMWLLSVGGCSSGVGKTELICRLLESLPGWGALKTSLGRRSRPRLDPGWEIVTDPSVLDTPGSDTDRYRLSGAARVVWLRSRPPGLEESVPRCLRLFDGLPGVVVEGNSHVPHSRPDRLILVARAGMEEIKPTAGPLLARADRVVINRDAGASAESVAEVQDRIRAAGRTGPTVSINAGDVVDVGLAGLRSEVATWFPSRP